MIESPAESATSIALTGILPPEGAIAPPVSNVKVKSLSILKPDILGPIFCTSCNSVYVKISDKLFQLQVVL